MGKITVRFAKNNRLFVTARILFSQAIKEHRSKNKILTPAKYNSDKSLTISADKKAYGTYTHILNFRELSNTSTSPKPSYRVKNDGDEIETFSPTNKDQSVQQRTHTAILEESLALNTIKTLFMLCQTERAEK